jgi:hypothetical protein
MGNTTPKSKPSPRPSIQSSLGQDPAVAAAVANAQTATTGKSSAGGTSNKDFLAAPIDNTNLQLRDANGKALPAQITVGQLLDSLNYTRYNSGVIEAMKLAAAGASPATFSINGATSLSPTGSITPLEINGIKGLLRQGFDNNPKGTLDVSKIFNDIKTGAYAGSDIKSTIDIKQYDQPNIEASKNTINNIFLDMLGRQATDKEINKYANQYLQYAAKNPTSKTTGQYDYGYIPTPAGGQRLQRQSTQETGVQNNLTEQAYIQNQLRDSVDYKTYAAADTAFSFLKNLAGQQSEGA